MKVEGRWIPVGRYADRFKAVEMTADSMDVERIKGIDKVKYELIDTSIYNSVTVCSKNVKLEGSFSEDDYILHEEEHDGHSISILSKTTFEYDGRGLIILSEYVHEDDVQYASGDFFSKLYHHLNDRKPISMCMPPDSPNVMGFMGMRMMGMEMMQNLNNSNVVPSANTSADTSAGEPWKCVCGYENESGRFCSECGMPKPQ